MRRILIASCIALLPGLAMAQSDDATPPSPDNAAPGMMAPDNGPGAQGDWGKDHHGHHKGMMDLGAMVNAFYAANTTHDGHLTLAQAKAANMKPVVDNFTDIDVKKRGYVTFYDIEAWQLDDMAKHLEAKADALRAKDK